MLPLFRFTKAKMEKKKLCIKIPSVPPCTQPVSVTKWMSRQKLIVYTEVQVLPLKGSTSGVSLTWGRVQLAGFSMHSCVARGLCLRVHHCTAVRLMVKGRRRRSKRGGRNGGGEAEGPALPALGPAQAGNCNSSSGVRVSSAWLSLASPKWLPFLPCLYP